MTGMSESRQNYKLYCEVEAVAKDLPEDAKQWGISVMITAKILECMGCELILERKEKTGGIFFCTASGSGVIKQQRRCMVVFG